jgi:hypothetical protein
MKKHTTLEDAWSAQKAKIEELAAEQVAADIALVEAQRALDKATKLHASAVARKTTAEKKLTTFRANLGGE